MNQEETVLRPPDVRAPGKPPLTGQIVTVARADRDSRDSPLSALQSALENRRLLVALPFALIIGILAYRSLPAEPQLWALLILAAVPLSATWFLRRSFFGFNLAVLIAAMAIGTLLLPLHGRLFGTDMLYGSLYGTFEATVDAIHSDDGEDARIIVSNIVEVGEAGEVPMRRARLFLPSDQRPMVGDRITADIRFYAIPGPVFPDSYDSQFQSYFDGIGAFGSVTSEITTLQTASRGGVTERISQIRQGIGERIDAVLEGDADAIARALVIGDQGLIPDDTRDAMASAGLAHMLAISGLHLTLVAGGVFAALRMGLALSYTASLRWNLKQIAAVGGILTALFYLSISGASVSAIRATIMLVLVFGAVLAGRRALTMRNVAIAALVVIVTDPASIFRPSFQLSFAAVTALVATYESLRPGTARQRGWWGQGLRYFGGLAVTSIIAGLATGLFAAFHFQQMAPLGVLGNIAAVPLLALVVLPSAFLGVFVMPLGLEPLFFTVTGWGIERILEIARFVSALSGPLTSAPPINLLALLFGMLSLLWMAFFETRWRFAAVIVAVPLIGLFGLAPRPDLLMADTTQALAVRTGEDMRLVAGRNGTFAVNAWSENLQEPISALDDESMCDSEACFVRSAAGYALSYVKSRDAFAEDCRLAYLVVTRLTAPDACREHAQVIDRNDLLRGGVHWARWRETEFEVRPAVSDPDRPWRNGYSRSD